MEFRILGPLEVVESGRNVTPRRAKQRALLTLLLVRADEIIPSDELIDALWGEKPPETARTALHGHVSSLRKLLGRKRIETTQGGYVVHVEAGELDVDECQKLLTEARGAKDATVRAELLRRAVQLWRGDPLAEFRDESFARSEVARLEELRLAAAEQRIDCDLELGRNNEVLPELEQLVAAHPLREQLRAQLMLALYRAGRQTDALHVYQEGRRILAEELGIDLGPALQSLERQILTHDPALDLQARSVRAPEQARKFVTVLVVELGSSDFVDPEDFARLVQPAIAGSRSVLESFGATVKPLFANALVAIFGAPRAHEDDAERSARAALALRGQLVAKRALNLRVGIESGEALVTIEGDQVEVTGGVFGAASTLQATAPANAILVSEGVYRTTCDAIQYEPFAPGVWSAKVIRRSIRRRVGEVPFIGRDHEVALLERIYRRAVSEGNVQLVTIASEPGRGKTRLTKEFRARLTSQTSHLWREGGCLPYGDGVTFWALGEVVKAQAGILESDEPDRTSQKLEIALGELTSNDETRAWLRTHLAPLVGLEGPTNTTRQQSFAAWTRFLEEIALGTPLVLIFEDLHWAGQELVEFIDYLVTSASGPMLVVCTTRLEFLDHHAAWGGGKRNTTTITLPPLTPDETERLFTALLGRPPRPAEVKRAGGNPLFAQELVRRASALAEVDEAIPESIQALIAARLDTLPAELKELTFTAAVVGEVFWSGALSSITGQPQEQVDAMLNRLVTNEVVHRRRITSVAGQNEYAFLHILLRDVAYGQIPRRRRAEKHEAVAAWIEGLAGHRVTDHAEFIAHHYAAALELARSTGGGGPELQSKARRFLVLAGDRAMSLDVRAAERFYRRALMLVGADEAERSRLLLRSARAAQEAGRLEDATRTYEEAISSLGGGDDPLLLGEALLGKYMALWRTGRTRDARHTLIDAVAMLERQPAGPELATAYVNMARDYSVSGRSAEAYEWSEKAIQLARRLGLQPHVARAVGLRGFARCLLNDLEGLDDLHESLRLGVQLGLGFEPAMAYINLGDWVAWTQGPAKFLALSRAGIEFCEARGLSHAAFWLRMQSLWQLYEVGDWDQVLRAADVVIDWERSQGESQITAGARCCKARVLIGRGDVGEAKALAEAFLPVAREVSEPWILAPALGCAAVIEMAGGNQAEAIHRVEELDRSTRQASPIYRSLWLPDVVRVCVAANELDLAGVLLKGLDLVAQRHVNALLAARAVLTEAKRELDEAISEYRDAGERWQSHGYALEEGQALLGEARCLAALGRLADARSPVEAARRIFTRLGASPLRDSAEQVGLHRAPLQ